MTNDEPMDGLSRRKLLASAGAAALAGSIVALPGRAAAEQHAEIDLNTITDEVLVEAIKTTLVAGLALQPSKPSEAPERTIRVVSLNLKDPDLAIVLQLNQGGYGGVEFPSAPDASLPSAELDTRLAHLLLSGEYSITSAVSLKEVRLSGDRDALRGLSWLPLALREQYKMTLASLLYGEEV